MSLERCPAGALDIAREALQRNCVHRSILLILSRVPHLKRGAVEKIGLILRADILCECTLEYLDLGVLVVLKLRGKIVKVRINMNPPCRRLDP